jgi:ribosomal-protein-alanine N-acetyltransferase
MPTQYTIRRFKPADMDRVLEIERASFGKDAYDRKLFAEYSRKWGELFLLAERTSVVGRALACPPRRAAGTVDGYSIVCICERKGILAASLESIAVAPRARGKGAASSLLRSTIRRLKLRGIRRLTLMVRSSNSVALQFYERRGFTAVRRAPGYYEDGEEGLVMRMAL